ncbi:MAG: HYR domain-containing protein, partial [Bacteroidota bacterium]
MNWQSKSHCWLIIGLLCWAHLSLKAQQLPTMGANDFKEVSISTPFFWAGYKIPDTETLTISLKGGDGGHIDFKGSCDRITKGGEAAKVEATYKVGPGGLMPGGTIVGFIGTHGISSEPLCSNGTDLGAGGGGASTVLYLPPNTDGNGFNWRILAVAGGGGGAAQANAGISKVNRLGGEGGQQGIEGGGTGEKLGATPTQDCADRTSSPIFPSPGIGASIRCTDVLQANTTGKQNGLNLANLVGGDPTSGFTISLIPFAIGNIANTAGQSDLFPNGGLGFFGGGSGGFGGGGGGGIYGGASQLREPGGGGGSYVDKVNFAAISTKITAGRTGGGNIQHGNITFTTCSDPTPSQAICRSSAFNVELDDYGSGLLRISDIDNGSRVSSCIDQGSIRLRIGNYTHPNTYPLNCASPANFTATIEVLGPNEKVLDQCNTAIKVKGSIPAICRSSTLKVELDDNAPRLLRKGDFIKGSRISGCIADESVSLRIGNNTYPAVYRVDCNSPANFTATIEVPDVNGDLQDACITQVTVVDKRPLVARCHKSLSINLDEDGQAVLDPRQLDNGSNNNCSNSLTYAASQTNFDCSHLGDNQVSLTIEDINGNKSECSTTVKVVENGQATANCRDNIVVRVDANGYAFSTEPSAIDDGSLVPLCAELLLFDDRLETWVNSIPYEEYWWNNKSEINLGIIKEINGQQTVLSNCYTSIIYKDFVLPAARCLERLTVHLDQNGQAMINPSQLDDGSFDNTPADLAFSASQTLFDCSSPKSNVVTLTVEDDFGNASKCSTTVWVSDNIDPQMNCQESVTLFLDENGQAKLDPRLLDNGSTDNCGINEYVASKTEFDCSNLGVQEVNLTVRDHDGNTAECDVQLNVVDKLPPQAKCHESLTINLEEDNVKVLDPKQLDNGSTDNCSIANYSASQTNFDCSHRGDNQIRLTVEDLDGNKAECTTTVKVVENRQANAICRPNVEIELDENSQGLLSVTDVNRGSNGNSCHRSSMQLRLESNEPQFSYPIDCETPKNFEVTLEILDDLGNLEAQCPSTITVLDKTVPKIDCKENLTLVLDESGQASLDPQQLDNGSTDNCSIANYSASQTNFDCSHRGDN